MQTYFLAYQAGKLVIDGMTRTCSDDAPLDGSAYQGHVADDVKQFVARTLILPL